MGRRLKYICLEMVRAGKTEFVYAFKTISIISAGSSVLAILPHILCSLKPGEIYYHNDVYESPVLKAELSVDGKKTSVLCTTGGVTNFALSEITFEDGQYVHTSVQTFFSEEGAEKYYTISLGKEWTGGDVFEDFC